MERVLEHISMESFEMYTFLDARNDHWVLSVRMSNPTGISRVTPSSFTCSHGDLIVTLACFVGMTRLKAPQPSVAPILKATAAGEGKFESEPVANRRTQVGRASWYSLPSKTANGEQMSSEDMTAAHPSLPFGTQVEVENLDNGRKVTVRVNDRGPFVAERIIDLSKAAAQSLDMIVNGIATVRINPQPKSTE
jgi:rare lipoprotein A